jgi:hypothetical protein
VQQKVAQDCAISDYSLAVVLQKTRQAKTSMTLQRYQ